MVPNDIKSAHIDQKNQKINNRATLFCNGGGFDSAPHCVRLLYVY